MNRINHIRIDGFRRLRGLDLPLKPLMVLIGANGVGKSSLLDAFTLLSSSASGRLNETISQFGGISSLLTRDQAEELSIHIRMEVPNHNPLQYELHLQPKGAGYAISKELLYQESYGHPQPFWHIQSKERDIRYFDPSEGKLFRPDWEHNPLETSLSQVPRMFRQPEELRRMLATATHYHVLDVGPRAPVKLPQAMRPATLPGANGEDLVPYLYYLRETDNDRFEAVIDALRAAFPDFESLQFPPVAAGTLSMTWKDRNFSKPLYMHELSEGTLRFLWLVSLLQSPSLSTITMIDEPEVSLHPELLSLLAELMREAAQRTQLIIATHSDRFIRFLQPGEVVVMDIGPGGSASAVWADTLDLETWLADFSLDEIWRMGRMGGRA